MTLILLILDADKQCTANIVTRKSGYHELNYLQCTSIFLTKLISLD